MSATPWESVLRRDRAVVLASLLAVVGLAWLYLAKMALDMAEGDMRLMGLGEVGAAATASAVPWDAATFALMFAMWAVMMLGMMLPSASPMILLVARIYRGSGAADQPLLATAAFAAGYVVTWTLFSAAATALQWGLGRAALLSPMMASASAVLAVVLFAAAGVYQLTPLKQACLRHCRSPLHFVLVHWRRGTGGALRMGLHHGTYCVGCCWFLMGLLFFGGVMNLAWVAAIAVFVLLEKVAPYGELVARTSGLVMLAFAGYLALAAAG